MTKLDRPVWRCVSYTWTIATATTFRTRGHSPPVKSARADGCRKWLPTGDSPGAASDANIMGFSPSAGTLHSELVSFVLPRHDPSRISSAEVSKPPLPTCLPMGPSQRSPFASRAHIGTNVSSRSLCRNHAEYYFVCHSCATVPSQFCRAGMNTTHVNKNVIILFRLLHVHCTIFHPQESVYRTITGMNTSCVVMKPLLVGYTIMTSKRSEQPPCTTIWTCCF